jgi:tetratricopeptide (TPR) repeat protein
MLKRLPFEVVQAATHFSDGDLSAAAHILRSYLRNGRSHVEALRLLARIERERNALHEAAKLLESALELAPNSRPARLDYLRVLLDDQKYLRAYNVIVGLLNAEDSRSELLSLYAAACVGLGRHERAIQVYRQLQAGSPTSAELHVVLGHSLQSIGHQTEAIESYHAAANVRPSFGDAYWSLANLKTYRFSETQIACMRVEEAASSIHVVDRYHLCFALGKAYEDRCEYAESWQFYERGNALKRAEVHWNAERFEADARKQIAMCTAERFASARLGAPNSDPIFIVGLPRSGSTLVEQILACHSSIDATQELPEIPRIVRELEEARPDPENPLYPGVLFELESDTLRTLGERYLSDTRVYRGNKAHFIDKMPNNFRHIGLIRLILPNAKIIDVRREPMACGFSNFKQLFATGQEFSYSIEDIARYYRTYLELMRHWSEVLPGQILRVCYDDLVEDLESTVRRILEFLGLNFEPTCIDFYKQKRNIATASSEQVRQPLFREGLSQWRNYEPWLGSLRDSLGDAVIRYQHYGK